MIVSVDLAYKNFADVGVVALHRTASRTVRCDIIPLLKGRPTPDSLAEQIDHICLERGARTLLLDGPQAWKSPYNSLQHSRVCERQLNTPAKTGEPEVVKPANYTAFVVFSIAV